MKFAAVHGGSGRIAGVLLPSAGVPVVAAVLWFSVEGSTSAWAAPMLGLYWCVAGLAIALAASGRAERVGATVAAEVAQIARTP